MFLGSLELFTVLVQFLVIELDLFSTQSDGCDGHVNARFFAIAIIVHVKCHSKYRMIM